MAHSHSRTDTARYAARAIERMSDLAIAPTPANFTVWYAYVSGAEPDLVHMIDHMLETGAPFTGPRCAELHARCRLFVADEAAGERDAALRHVREEIEHSG